MIDLKKLVTIIENWVKKGYKCESFVFYFCNSQSNLRFQGKTRHLFGYRNSGESDINRKLNVFVFDVRRKIKWKCAMRGSLTFLMFSPAI